jgi:hypothetical protein
MQLQALLSSNPISGLFQECSNKNLHLVFFDYIPFFLIANSLFLGMVIGI